jgi:prophage regulatory protein
MGRDAAERLGEAKRSRARPRRGRGTPRAQLTYLSAATGGRLTTLIPAAVAQSIGSTFIVPVQPTRAEEMQDSPTTTADKPDRILRLPAVLERTGLSRSTLYRKIKAGTFPKQIAISMRCAGWRESAVTAWLQNPIFYSVEASER